MTENSKEEKEVCYACGGRGFVYVYPDHGIDRSYRRDKKHEEICYVCGGRGYIRKMDSAIYETKKTDLSYLKSNFMSG